MTYVKKDQTEEQKPAEKPAAEKPTQAQVDTFISSHKTATADEIARYKSGKLTDEEKVKFDL